MTAIGNKDWVGSKNWHFGAFGGPGTASQQPTIPRGAGFQARGRARRFSEPFCMVELAGFSTIFLQEVVFKQVFLTLLVKNPPK